MKALFILLLRVFLITIWSIAVGLITGFLYLVIATWAIDRYERYLEKLKEQKEHVFDGFRESATA